MAVDRDMAIRSAAAEDAERWLSMRRSLWPETDVRRHREEMAAMLSDSARHAVLFCESGQGRLVGFAEVSLRDWAEGCSSSPVGYLEGWYVEESERRQGLGGRLLSAAEDWARSRGCTEMASDTDLGNDASEAAHRKLGYEVAARVIAFRKALVRRP